MVFVPAFSGLGAPYWNMNVKGAIFGITRDIGINELCRATLESLAFPVLWLFCSQSFPWTGCIEGTSLFDNSVHFFSFIINYRYPNYGEKRAFYRKNH